MKLLSSLRISADASNNSNKSNKVSSAGKDRSTATSISSLRLSTDTSNSSNKNQKQDANIDVNVTTTVSSLRISTDASNASNKNNDVSVATTVSSLRISTDTSNTGNEKHCEEYVLEPEKNCDKKNRSSSLEKRVHLRLFSLRLVRKIVQVGNAYLKSLQKMALLRPKNPLVQIFQLACSLQKEERDSPCISQNQKALFYPILTKLLQTKRQTIKLEIITRKMVVSESCIISTKNWTRQA